MKFYHVTKVDKEKQDILIPRIPDVSMADEDISIKRISLGRSIENCLVGMGQPNNYCVGNYIRVYVANISIFDKSLIGWRELYKNNLVPDAPITHEYWYKEKLYVSEYHEYVITEITRRKCYIVNADLKPKLLKIISRNRIHMPFLLCFKTPVEILEYFKGKCELQLILNGLTNEKARNPQDEAMHRTMFNNQAPIEYFYDYRELEYIYEVKLQKVPLDNR